MPTTFITFRGAPDVAIGYRDHGYEPDTNCHEIEWWFEDPEWKDAEATEAEEDAILKRLYEIAAEPDSEWYDRP